MKKNSRNNARKERIIMIASSAFVLTALTMTGIYMKSNNEEQQDDGYTIDFTALEDNVREKGQEIARGAEEDLLAGLEESAPMEDDLDYMPMEAGSGLVELPGLTDRIQEGPVSDKAPVTQEASSTGKNPEAPAVEEGIKTATPAPGTSESGRETAEGNAAGNSGEAASESTAGNSGEAASGGLEESASGSSGEAASDAAGEDTADNPPQGKILHFAAGSGLLRPVNGEVLIPYSMESSTYFSTLDQYKYNSALVIQAQEDTPVVACAEGRVIEIYENEEIGQAVTMELGDGYQITYGQLKDIRVRLNDYVNCGETFAQVASPTKYYCLEGSNLYLRLTMDGTPINPEALFR